MRTRCGDCFGESVGHHAHQPTMIIPLATDDLNPDGSLVGTHYVLLSAARQWTFQTDGLSSSARRDHCGIDVCNRETTTSAHAMLRAAPINGQLLLVRPTRGGGAISACAIQAPKRSWHRAGSYSHHPVPGSPSR